MFHQSTLNRIRGCGIIGCDFSKNIHNAMPTHFEKRKKIELDGCGYWQLSNFSLRIEVFNMWLAMLPTAINKIVTACMVGNIQLIEIFVGTRSL